MADINLIYSQKPLVEMILDKGEILEYRAKIKKILSTLESQLDFINGHIDKKGNEQNGESNS